MTWILPTYYYNNAAAYKIVKCRYWGIEIILNPNIRSRRTGRIKPVNLDHSPHIVVIINSNNNSNGGRVGSSLNNNIEDEQ